MDKRATPAPGHIVGTATNLEKPYARLSTEPDPSQIRPEPVLVKSLALVQSKAKLPDTPYDYLSDQLRSIRQDLAVQNINNEFSVSVYETHARIALQSHDLSQFNQCQTQLHELYRSGLPGARAEFLSYRILYCGLHCFYDDLSATLREAKNVKAPICVKHAVGVVKCLLEGDYHGFFRLRKDAPNMSGSLMDIFMDRVRATALQTVAKS